MEEAGEGGKEEANFRWSSRALNRGGVAVTACGLVKGRLAGIAKSDGCLWSFSVVGMLVS